MQQLFELHKLNLSQTAVNTYNTAAAALDHEKLNWKKAAKYSFLEEFMLLRDTRNDVSDRDWSKPVGREVVKLRRRIQRAHEEVTRCMVEVHRLHTAIVDEDWLFVHIVQQLKNSNDPILPTLQDFVLHRQCVNGQLLSRIAKVYSLQQFTGTCGPSHHLGSDIIPQPS
ncbi:hypothetical protein C8Q75DRAFT_729359 [Abortiporus biennis]|nr:hypothetical protein C8Q75DRAFT_729359 [Abortiporus biennis]